MITIKVTHDNEIDGIVRRLQNLDALRENIERIALASVRTNFDVGGRPRWKPSLRALKTGGKTLVKSGSLRDSIRSFLSRGGLHISSGLPYARIHQLGGRAGRHFKANIPARPFLVLQPKDVTAIERLVSDYLTGRK